MGIFDRFKRTPTPAPAPVPDAPLKLTDGRAYSEWQNFLELDQGNQTVPTAKDIVERFKDTLADQIQEDASTRARTSIQLQSHDFVALAKIYQDNNSEVQDTILGIMKELNVPNTVIKDFQDKNFAAYRPAASNRFKVYEGIGTDGKDTLIAAYETKSYRDEQAQVHIADGDSLYTKTMSGLTIDVISCIDSIQCFSDYVNVAPELIIDNDVDLSNYKLIADNEKIYPQNMSTKGCQLFEREYTNEPEAPIPNIGAVYAKILEKVNGKEFSSRTNEVAKIDNKIAQMKFNLDEDLNNNKSIVFNKIRYANDAMVVGEDGHGKYAKVNLDNGDLSTQMYRNSGDPAAVITGKLTSESLAQLKAMVEKRIQVEYGAPVNEDQEIASPIPKAAKQNKAEQNISSRPEGLSSLIKDAAEEKDNEPAPSVQSQDSHDVR